MKASIDLVFITVFRCWCLSLGHCTGNNKWTEKEGLLCEDTEIQDVFR